MAGWDEHPARLCRSDVTAGTGKAENGSRENGWPGEPEKGGHLPPVA